jgi:hypothetical protein
MGKDMVGSGLGSNFRYYSRLAGAEEDHEKPHSPLKGSRFEPSPPE